MNCLKSCCVSARGAHEDELSVNTPLLSGTTQRGFSRWMLAFIIVTVAHLLLFAAYSFMDVYSLMTRDHNPPPPRNDSEDDLQCGGITDLPVPVAIFYTAFNFFNFVLMGSWIIAFWVNYKSFQITELGPSTQATLNRHKQVLRKVHPYLMLWLYVLLSVDSFGLAVKAFYFHCLSSVNWKIYQVYSDIVLVFIDYLSLVIYPILFSGFMTEKPLRAAHSPQSEIRNLITGKVGLYLLLFVVHAVFYLSYWIVDILILFEGFIVGETDFYKSYVFFFTGLNCLNFWVLAAWISTFVVGHFRGASVREALYENFSFFLILLHYLLFTDAIGVALDAFQFNYVNSNTKFEFIVDFVLTGIDLLSIVFYPTIMESFFPLVNHQE